MIAAEKARRCPYCQRDFRRLEHLQRHVRLHTNEKPYNCSCGKSFGRRDLLKRHQRISHNDQKGDSISDDTEVNRSALILDSAGVAGASYLDAPHGDRPAYHPSGSPQRLQAGTFPALLHDDGIEGVAEVINGQDQGEMLPDDFDDPLEGFTSFIDNMGLFFDSDTLLDHRSTLSEHGPLPNALPMGKGQAPSAHKSRLGYEEEHTDHSPTLLPIPLNPMAVQAAVYMPLLKITEAQREHLLQELAPFQHLMPSFILPSRHTLTRFLNAYFDGVYPHMPFMHGPSFNPEKHPLELVLAMAAAGGQYRYEHRKGLMLYFASKTIFQERQRCKGSVLLHSQQLLVQPPPVGSVFTPTIADDIRCLLNLIIYATWQRDTEIVKEACGFQSLIVRLLRESGLVEGDIPDSDKLDWQTWLQYELDRRVKIFAFAFLNLQSVAYNLPPILLSDEINLRLPCTCEEWRTVNETHWRQVRQDIRYQEQSLFQNAPGSIRPVPSPTASITLIHGLLHRIILSRQASVSDAMPQIDIFENALRRWTTIWQLAPESSLDPLNPNGPIPFTSTALLGLAYTRLQLDLGPSRMLMTRDPRSISNALLASAPLVRDRRLLPALLHATHALSIPVKLGVEYVSRSQAFVWSVQHAICGLEFAVLLSKWIHAIAGSQQHQRLDGQHPAIPPSLSMTGSTSVQEQVADGETEHEERVLNWIRQIVEEGRTSLEDSDRSCGTTLDYQTLAEYVVKLWARIMRGNVQWPFVDIIGQSLELYGSEYNVLPQSIG